MEGLLKNQKYIKIYCHGCIFFQGSSNHFFFLSIFPFSFRYLMNKVPDSCPCRGQQRALLLVKRFDLHPNETLQTVIPSSGFQALVRPRQPAQSSELTHHLPEHGAAA